MAAPVTNQNYTQQINQAFDMLKYATPQQMQVVSQQVQQNPNSPEAMALAMAAQYQQQARAPRPQAPQGTVLQQRLGEFQQTSPQGLPQVGQNQMAMQQAAQQNPMFGAGLAVAPENTEQAPQQMAATGGITALAHGGEVRGFEVGGPLKSLKNLNVDPNDPNLELNYNLQSAVGDTAVADEALGGTPDASSLQYGDNKYAKDRAAATHKNLLSEAKTKKQAPSEKGIGSLPVAKDQTSMAELEKYLTPKGSKVDPSSYDADAIVANMLNNDTMPKFSQPPVGKHDIVHAPADTSSAARNEASPTAKGESYSSADTGAAIAEIARLRGPEADMSEAVATAKENAANASRDKGIGALVGGIGGMLSAQTPNIGQAAGAGMLAGLSSYQSGAKEQGTADKELMALQMAQKKSDLAGHREATDLFLAQQAKQREAVAAARAKAQEQVYTRDTELMKGKQSGEYSLTKEDRSNDAAINLQGLNEASQMRLKEFDSFLKENRIDPTDRAGVITSALAFAGRTGASEEESKQLVDNYLKYLGPQTSTNQSTGFGQPLKGGMYLK